jgi:predicted SprT family Zn-dependent metalloprotease
MPNRNMQHIKEKNHIVYSSDDKYCCFCEKKIESEVGFLKHVLTGKYLCKECQRNIENVILMLGI